jgi:hypothetical protein
MRYLQVKNHKHYGAVSFSGFEPVPMNKQVVGYSVISQRYINY